jgi:hypothetical protein
VDCERFSSDRQAMRMVVIVAAVICASAPGCMDASSSPSESTCADPAPLLGSRGPRTVDYGVLLQDGVDVIAETARLSKVYRIKPTTVVTLIPWFSADFDDDTRDRLLCEPTVRQIEYNDSGTPPPAAPR